jgi:hypothetical protein
MTYFYSAFYSLFYEYPWLGRSLAIATFLFQIWMIIDCVRSGNDWYWIWVILIFGPIGALVYFFGFVYQGTEIEQSWSKRRIRQRQIEELQALIHNLDKAHHWAELGDLYRLQKRWALAREAYEAALQREPGLFDAKVHLGYVLLGEGRPAEAWKLLAPAYESQPRFENGDLLWHCARCQAALGRLPAARELYERLLAGHSYLQAQVEFAEVLDRLGDRERCRQALELAVADGKSAPRFLRKTNRPWLRKAQWMLRTKRRAR